MEIIWHYTSEVHLKSIVSDSFLKVSEADRRFGYTPAAWFSRNQMWEPTATKMFMDVGGNITFLTMQQQLEFFGLARIGVEFSSELISWAKYKHIGKIPLHEYIAMEKSGIRRGAHPSDWYCALRNISLRNCKAVETYDGKNWNSIYEA